MVRLVLGVCGPLEPVAFAVLVAALMFEALRRAEHLRIDAELYGLMLAESLVYAVALGLVGSFAVQRVLAVSAAAGARLLAHDVVLSVGAGVYEEALFRVGLLGAVWYALKTWARMRPGFAAFLGIVVSSVAFAACHHIGPYGDPVEVPRLAFRFGMGVAFAGIYIYRGLGIVVYTHALYDVFVSLNR
jgi:membrane protease YdiL (CAAX protease family)